MNFVTLLPISKNTISSRLALHVLKKAASFVGLYTNAKNTKYMSVNCQGQVLTNLEHTLKQVEQFSYLDRNMASTTKDVKIRIAKA